MRVGVLIENGSPDPYPLHLRTAIGIPGSCTPITINVGTLSELIQPDFNEMDVGLD
jgi:hypothetical protein